MDLLPRPSSFLPDAATLAIGSYFAIQTPMQLLGPAKWWSQVAAASLNLHANISVVGSGPDASPSVQPEDHAHGTTLQLELDPSLPTEAYRLNVNAQGIRIQAATATGAQHGLQTLRQLLAPAAFRAANDAEPHWELPHVQISDEPRFGWRGVLLDVARHFMPLPAVLRFIDHAAAHKLNRVHLHLTDDQGWRIQIDAFPKLTEVGAWRTNTMHGNWRSPVNDERPHGGFYTKADLQQIVSYARQRGVTVVPEVNMPGHTQAVVAAYPELGVHGTPADLGVMTGWGFSPHTVAPTAQAVDFFRTVLDEVLEIFDSPWVCLGGDEVVTSHWKDDPRLVAHAQGLGLADPGELQYWLLREVSKHLQGHGRTPLVWDEALRGELLPGTVVLAWRGAAIAEHAMAAGFDTIMAPEQFLYLDHRAADGPQEPVPVGFVRTVGDLAEFEPDPEILMETRPEWIRHRPGTSYPSGQRRGQLLGAQAQLWSEHLDSPRRVDYAAFPRLAAFAETVWTQREQRDAADLLARLGGPHAARLAALGIEARPDAGPHPWQQRPGVRGWFRDVELEGAVAGWLGAAAYFNWHDIDPNLPNPELEAIRAPQPDDK